MKKGLAALILTPSMKHEEEEEGEYDAGLEAAMEEFIEAIKTGDAKGAAEAFKAAQALCDDDT